MGDLCCFWGNDEFHDATLLLGSDQMLLEQSRVSLQADIDGAKPQPKKREGPAAKTSQSNKRACRCTSA